MYQIDQNLKTNGLNRWIEGKRALFTCSKRQGRCFSKVLFYFSLSVFVYGDCGTILKMCFIVLASFFNYAVIIKHLTGVNFNICRWLLLLLCVHISIWIMDNWHHNHCYHFIFLTVISAQKLLHVKHHPYIVKKNPIEKPKMSW